MIVQMFFGEIEYVYVFGGCVVGGIRPSKKKEQVSALESEAGKDIKEKN